MPLIIVGIITVEWSPALARVCIWITFIPCMLLGWIVVSILHTSIHHPDHSDVQMDKLPNFIVGLKHFACRRFPIVSSYREYLLHQSCDNHALTRWSCLVDSLSEIGVMFGACTVWLVLVVCYFGRKDTHSYAGGWMWTYFPTKLLVYPSFERYEFTNPLRRKPWLERTIFSDRGLH